MTFKYVKNSSHKLELNWCSVSVSVFTGYSTGVARTRIRVIGVNFAQGKRNLDRDSGEFELSEIAGVNRVKMTEK